MVKLTNLAETFAQNRIKGMKPAEAYRAACGNADVSQTQQTTLANAKKMEADPLVQERMAELQGALMEYRRCAEANLIAEIADVQAYLTTVMVDRDKSTGDRLKSADMLLRTHGGYKDRIISEGKVQLTYAERKEALLHIIKEENRDTVIIEEDDS